MITYVLTDGTHDKFWDNYVDAAYSKSGYRGFREYVQAMVPAAVVYGTTKDGLNLRFEHDVDFTAFILKWVDDGYKGRYR